MHTAMDQSNKSPKMKANWKTIFWKVILHQLCQVFNDHALSLADLEQITTPYDTKVFVNTHLDVLLPTTPPMIIQGDRLALALVTYFQTATAALPDPLVFHYHLTGAPSRTLTYALAIHAATHSSSGSSSSSRSSRHSTSFYSVCY